MAKSTATSGLQALASGFLLIRMYPSSWSPQVRVLLQCVRLSRNAPPSQLREEQISLRVSCTSDVGIQTKTSFVKPSLAYGKRKESYVRPRHSQRPSDDGFKYVPDRIWAEREEVADLFKAGAKIFLCGSATKLAKSTNETFVKIVKEQKGCSDEEAEERVSKQKVGRYVTDIFG